MNDETFEPKNDLEHKLLAAANGELSGEDLLVALMESQVFMPVEDEVEAIANFQRSTYARPLVVQDEVGTHVLVLFSSPERARIAVAEFPRFGGGLLAEFRWVLERVDEGAGITINPGWDVGMDLDPETISQLVRDLNADRARLH